MSRPSHTLEMVASVVVMERPNRKWWQFWKSKDVVVSRRVESRWLD